MDGQLEALRQDIGSVKDEIAKTKQDLAAAEQARNKEEKRVLLDLLLSLNNQLLSLNNQLLSLKEEKNILLRRQAPSVPLKVLDVHVLVNAQEDLKMKSEYDIPAGVVRFRDFEESLGIKVLKYAVSTSDAAPGTEDYKVAVGTKALPSNTTSLWLKAKREGQSFLPAWIKFFVLVNVNVILCRGLLLPFKALTKHKRLLDGLAVFVACLQKLGKVQDWWHGRQAKRPRRSNKRQATADSDKSRDKRKPADSDFSGQVLM